MRRINMQKGFLLLTYLCIILGFFWFSMVEVRNVGSVIVDDYVPIRDDIITTDDNVIQSEANQKESMEPDVFQVLNNYQDYYQGEFTKQLVWIVLQFSIVFISTSIIFWILMHKLQKKEKILIAKDLASLKQYQELPEADPILKQAYETIRDSYEQHFEDYKRLHAYLSHEQKNALALLQNNLELKEYDRCAHNIEALHQGIEDLLTISDSAQDGTLYPVDAVEICARVCDDYSRQATISFHFDEEDCMILAKERWIYRTVANLVDNAVKYGAGNPIAVSVQQKDHQVIISVIDHGIGIDRKQQERIFQHHVRINELKKDGYGIGLSLVRHVVDLSHGQITIESEKGKGTAIHLYFPKTA